MRLWITFPEEWKTTTVEAAAMEGYRNDLNKYIRQLVREDLKRKSLLGVRNSKGWAGVVEG
jgi:Arc/MetJ family transcription regulator